MRIENYSDRYYLDVMKLVENFHKEAITEYLGLFDPKILIQTITGLKDSNSKNAFLLIVDDVCQGIMAGIEFKAMASDQKIFQEIIWYVNQPFRRYGVKLFKKAQELLKLNGIDIMIMAVLENSKSEKIKSFYERLGFKAMETHYMRTL